MIQKLKHRKDGTIHMGSFNKEMRKLVEQRKEQDRDKYLQSFRDIISQDIISPDNLKNLECIVSNLFPKISINIKPKVDGTPDLRCLPKELREIVKEEKDKLNAFKNIKMQQILSKETVSNEDLMEMLKIDNSNDLSRRWILFPSEARHTSLTK